MDIKQSKIEQLIEEIDQIILSICKAAQAHSHSIQSVNASYQKSAKNLIHYKEFRNHDLRKIQKKLKNLGLSRLANSGGHQLASLLKTKMILSKLIGKETINSKSGLSIKNGKKLLTNHTKELLGYRSKHRRVRIMVTQPTEAATNPEIVYDMVKSGMNCARINCAHDNQETWKAIIGHIKKASKLYGRKIKISMDLAGPKIRTGAIAPGPKVRKFKPERDDIGNVVNPSLIVFTAQVDEESDPHEIAVNPDWFMKLDIGDKITFTDTRNKKRVLKVIHKTENTVFVNCYDTSYIGTGTVFHCHKIPESVTVGELPPLEQSILLRTNDFLTIHQDQTYGEPALFDEDGNVLRQAHISCQLPEVFQSVKVGEIVLFDDGKIESVITEVGSESFTVRVTRARESGSKLRAEKGINFPATNIPISGLTQKDKMDMAFIVEHADIVNFSFVNSKEDVEELIALLTELNAIGKISIILKIETQKAFDNLSDILLTAMKTKYIGVMIARGDLAVETGWDHIGKVQKEILSLCNAAHIPVVWATQVLENLAKKGLPSRSEITDATTSLKAECVMLNKGPYINEAIQLLDKILSDMEKYNEKSETMLPRLEKLLA